jgi:hypothetical protein
MRTGTTNKCASFSIKGSTATLRTLSSLINPTILYTYRRSNGNDHLGLTVATELHIGGIQAWFSSRQEQGANGVFPVNATAALLGPYSSFDP